MTCRGIRGAITVVANESNKIIDGTTTLLKEMIHQNQVETDDIVSIFFSVTEDLNSTFPAEAARKMGLEHTPLLCFHEIKVPTGIEKCIRILMHINSTKSVQDIHHIYLENAKKLRPDIQND